MADPMPCHYCGKPTVPTVAGKYRQHKRPPGDPWTGDCPASGCAVPGWQPPQPVQVGDFAQPGRRLPEKRPMTPLGQEIAGRLKEMFHAYQQRQSVDNRGAQSHLGPSEIGTPCDRRLAMSLLRIPPSSPGGDGWAAFVGTAVHHDLADMFVWASGESGRYAVELPLTFTSALVPKGTGDLLDRTLFLMADHKLMGQWSLNKLATKGPSQTYRVQVHTYAYGARERGERIEHVAIIGWPRSEATLDNLYVYTEAYDPKIALDALARVDRISHEIRDVSGMQPIDISETFSIAEDCRYCPFFHPGGRNAGGCDGNR